VWNYYLCDHSISVIIILRIEIQINDDFNNLVDNILPKSYLRQELFPGARCLPAQDHYNIN
jgi:hypothetical protein